MNKITIQAILLLLAAAPVQAQVYKDEDKSPKERLNTFLDETGEGMRKAGRTIADFLGIESKDDADDVTIDGVKYMPLHTAYKFKADSSGITAPCKADFKRRYPSAYIISVVIPQEQWTETAIKENKRITMYKRVVYCYVLAKDGSDGYINARYQFVELRKPGASWVRMTDYWPSLVRADAIPNAHFQQLSKR